MATEWTMWEPHDPPAKRMVSLERGTRPIYYKRHPVGWVEVETFTIDEDDPDKAEDLALVHAAKVGAERGTQYLTYPAGRVPHRRPTD